MNVVRQLALSALLSFSTLCFAESPSAVQPAESDAMAEPALIGGEVLTILQAGRYQYMEIDAGSGSVWIAVVQQPVSIGQHITCSSATVMENFESKSLNRTFERVYLADAFQVDEDTTAPASSGGAAAALPEGHPAMGACPEPSAAGMCPDPSAAGICPEPSPTVAPIAALEKPEGGVTLAELVEQQEKLSGSDVVLRAQVTKVSLDIMEANWLHVQDASIDRDLVVSCKVAPVVGDVVLIRGKLERNITIGADHVYDLLIQGADVTIETSSTP